MIHFTLTFSKDAAQSPFAEALTALQVEHRIFAETILLRYRYRIWLLFVGWPRLARFAARAAWNSMLRAQPKPDVIVVGTHIEALVFGLMRALLPGRRPCLYLLGFIFTPRKNRLLDLLRRAYFTTVFSMLDGVICHSSKEQRQYGQIFRRSGVRFLFVPYGLHMHGHERYASADVFAGPENGRYAFSAGRSGRDYPTLFAAFDHLDLALHVVCDAEAALAGCSPRGHIQVFRSCYDDCYFRKLQEAHLVVVPLAVDDISAGQMVMIQAMAHRKPIIVSRTPTITDYVEHGVHAHLVDPGDPKAIAEAVALLNGDPEYAERLADNAYRAFVARYSMPAFVQGIVAAVGA